MNLLNAYFVMSLPVLWFKKKCINEYWNDCSIDHNKLQAYIQLIFL